MHYARYDGGVSLLVDEANGVSSVLVGRGVSGNTLISSVCGPAAVARSLVGAFCARKCYVC